MLKGISGRKWSAHRVSAVFTAHRVREGSCWQQSCKQCTRLHLMSGLVCPTAPSNSRTAQPQQRSAPPPRRSEPGHTRQGPRASLRALAAGARAAALAVGCSAVPLIRGPRPYHTPCRAPQGGAATAARHCREAHLAWPVPKRGRQTHAALQMHASAGSRCRVPTLHPLGGGLHQSRHHHKTRAALSCVGTGAPGGLSGGKGSICLTPPTCASSRKGRSLPVQPPLRPHPPTWSAPLT